MNPDLQKFQFVPANYPVRLGFEPIDELAFNEIRETVAQEFNEARSLKRLRAKNVRRIKNSETELLFEITIAHTVEFDWTWEGAEAFRPIAMDEIGLQESLVFDSNLWSGQIIEFDEANSRLYVLADRADSPPRKGSFLVRPFEFLRNLNEIYNGPAFIERERLPGTEDFNSSPTIHQLLKGRLNAALGNAPYRADNAGMFHDIPNAGIEELREWWKRSWGIIWGPPGTGKTYTTARQIAAVLASEPWIDTAELSGEKLPHERILLVSTTNRAVDAIALAIGKAVREHESAVPYLHEDRMV